MSPPHLIPEAGGGPLECGQGGALIKLSACLAGPF